MGLGRRCTFREPSTHGIHVHIFQYLLSASHHHSRSPSLSRCPVQGAQVSGPAPAAIGPLVPDILNTSCRAWLFSEQSDQAHHKAQCNVVLKTGENAGPDPRVSSKIRPRGNGPIPYPYFPETKIGTEIFKKENGIQFSH